jgi:LuxR family maltose regulon positive regulatory protein
VSAVGEDPSRLLKRLPEGVEVTLPDRIQFGLLEALEACNEGHEKGALEALTAAMRLAAASGHRQRFLDERPTLSVLLENAAARAGIILLPPHHDPFNDDLHAHDRSNAVQPLDLVEPLTVRELEVLAFLPSHRSYRQIGDELGLSTNTIKYHVKGIYRKLEADGRSAAIRKARDGGLIRQ